MGHPALVKCGEGIRGVIRWSEGRVLGDALRSECVDLVRRWNMFARLSDGVLFPRFPHCDSAVRTGRVHS
jgi:hypothetical protein